MLDKSQKRVVLIATIVMAMPLIAFLIDVASPPSSPAFPENKYDHPGNTTASKESGQHQITKSFRERIWDRTFEDPIAFYTLVLAVFTGVLSVVSITQIGFLIRTDKTTRIAAQAAEKSADVLPRIERAYVFAKVDLQRYAVAEGDPTVWRAAFFPVFMNHGRTPAVIKVVRFYRLNQLEYPQPPLTDVEITHVPDGLVIAGGDTWTHPGISETISFSQTEWDEITNLYTRRFFVGLIRYKDIVGAERETGFCWEFRPNGGVDGPMYFCIPSTLNYTT